MLDEKELYLELVTRIVDKYICKIFNEFKGIIRKNYNEFKVKTGSTFKEYINSSIGKYSYTKTILYKSKPVLLNNFYVCLDLKIGNKVIRTKSIKNILTISKNIIIKGMAGCGKSMLTRYLFLNVIKEEIGIPIFIELRNVNEDIFSVIFENLKKFNFPSDISLFKNLLKRGKFIIFLDGIDEVNPKINKKIQKEIIDLTENYKNNVFIVTSRPDEQFLFWSYFTELEIMPLNKNKASLLIKKLDFEKQIKNDFIKNFDFIFKNYDSFASNPLLLTLMLITYRDVYSIPNKVTQLYSQIYDTLFLRHDATKGHTREHFSKLDYTEFATVFSAFCLLSYIKRKVRFTHSEIFKYLAGTKKLTKISFNEISFEKDLLQSVCFLIQEGYHFTFIHKTFQEYFTASYIVKNCGSNTRYKLFNSLVLIENLSSYNVMDMIFELNRDIFEKEFLIPLLLKIKEDTKFNQIKEKEKSFHLFKELRSLFTLAIIPSPVNESFKIEQWVEEYKRYYRIYNDDLFKLINRIYSKIYPMPKEITDSRFYYEKKYKRKRSRYYYGDFLTDLSKKIRKNIGAIHGICLYHSSNIKEFRQLTSRVASWEVNPLKVKFISFHDLKKMKKLHTAYVSFFEGYDEYLYLMYVLKKVQGDQSITDNIIDDLIAKNE